MEDANRMDLHQLLRDWQWLRRLARGLTRDEALADDATQDTLLAAAHRPPRERSEGARAWLGTVLRNKLHNHRRSQRRRAELPDVTLEEAAGEEPSPEALVERIQLQRLVADLVLGLPAPLRDVVMLVYLDELTSEQVGARLRLPAGTVRWRLKTALERLRDELDRRHGGERERWQRALLPFIAWNAPAGAPELPSAAAPMTGSLWAGAAVLVAVFGALLWQQSCAGSDAAPGTSASSSSPSETRRGLGALQPAPTAPTTPTAPTAPIPPSTLDPEEKAVVLRGTVIDTGGGPIVSAQVAARSTRRAPGGVQARSFATRTDERGAFSLRLPAGMHTVRVTSPGYAGEERDLQLGSDFEQPFHLNPEARVAGVVLDASGQPVEGARVDLEAGRGATPIEAVETNRDGRFELRGLDPGSLVLSARWGEQIGRSVPLLVRLGSVLDGVVLTIRPGLALAGRVSDADGRPLPGVMLHLARGRDPLLGEQAGRTDPGGAFRIAGLPPGTYHLTMMAEGHPALTRRFVLPGDDRSPVAWTLPRGAEIEGRVVDRHGRPVGGAQVTADLDTTGDEGVLTAARTFSRPDGRFRLSGAVPGKSSLDAEHESLGSSLAQELDVPPDGLRDVLLKIGVGAFLVGHVRWDDGTPAPSAHVVARGPTTSARAFTGNDGTFRIGPLPPGRYRVDALWPNFPIRAAGREARRDRAEIELEAEAERTVTLELRALRATVSGQVRDKEGHPVEGAEVQAMQRAPQPRFPLHPKAISDAEGQFRVVSIPLGRYALHVRHPDYQPLEHVGQTTGDTTVTLTLTRRSP